jgi:TonB family protein
MGSSTSESILFSPLPERKPPWSEFAFSTLVQALAVAFLLWIRLLNPEVLSPPQHEYHVIEVVNTPAPVNHQPQPLRSFPVVVARVESTPEALHVPAPEPKPKVDDTPAPSVTISSKKLDPLPSANTPVIPRQLVKTNVFSTGSSATPTIARAPSQVQTGGFGDPNGVPSKDNDTAARRVNIAQLGSFDLPSGPGYGNGTGGAKGTRGVVGSSGFGDGVATGDNSGRVSASRGTVRAGGFGDADVPAPPTVRSRPAEAATPKTVPAEILSKPVPVYTQEARGLKIEGEVLLEVVFEASGRLHVVRLVRGLGHGLDDAAVHAAEQIRFKPALRDGQPSDSTAVVHIIFQLA